MKSWVVTLGDKCVLFSHIVLWKASKNVCTSKVEKKKYIYIIN